MDMDVFNTFKGMDAASQYAAPFCYELCGKSFILTRGLNHGKQMFPGITFADYPAKTVALDGAEYPYYAAKVTNELVFAAFMVGTEAYAGVFDVNKSVTPEQAAAEQTTMGDPNRPKSITFYADVAKGIGHTDAFSFVGVQDKNGENDLSGNLIEWTLAKDISAKFDYKTNNISLNMSGGMPFSAAITREYTANVAEGVYFQALPVSVFGSVMWLCGAFDFNKVRLTGALFGSGPQGVLFRELGGYGRVLTEN